MRFDLKQRISDWWNWQKTSWQNFKADFRETPKTHVAYYTGFGVPYALGIIYTFVFENWYLGLSFLGISFLIWFSPNIYYYLKNRREAKKRKSKASSSSDIEKSPTVEALVQIAEAVKPEHVPYEEPQPNSSYGQALDQLVTELDNEEPEE